jgi:serine phosphatase RsbU (regulator of sigma subunit)
VRLLQIASDRIASAIQTRQLALERAASSVLERSLLPGRLPVCPGLRFATRFVAAEHRVGGDWYDLFTLPSGTLWVVVGDVAGHGLSAAVVMGRIRSALRAYTMLDLPPEDVLTLVDRKVNHFEIGTIATVACAVVEPPYEAMTISLAGHPPPVMVAADRAPEFVDVDPSPPIGTNVDVRRRSATVALEPDSLVAFYTDGLVERRGESLDAGMERLLRAMSVGPAERVAADVMRDMIGTTVPIDDIALVVMRRGH